MKLNYFDTENREYYSAIVWINNILLEEYYSTKKEAKLALKNFKKKYPEYTDSYIRHYDENGCSLPN